MSHKTRRGQSLVEFALVLPLLLTILCAIIEFGWSFLLVSGLNAASRNGARVGGAGGTAADIQYAVDIAKGYSQPNAPVITVERPDGTPVASTDRTQGNYLTVRLTAPYQSFTRLVDLSKFTPLTVYTESNTFIINY